MNNRKPTYSSRWQPKRDEAAENLANRKGFSYDVNGDALYRQLKDQYVRQGRMAMMDTVGRTSALTGGYGNSYSQVAGQQVYQDYLTQLGDRLPELQAMALDRYNSETQRLRDQYDIYSGLENQDYDRYSDSVDDYYRDQDLLRQQEEFDYRKQRDQVSDLQDDRDFDYRRQRDQEDDRRWQEEFDEDRRRYERENPSQGATQSASQTDGKLSQAGQQFLESLPYPNAGSSGSWKRYVDARLQKAVENGQLSENDMRLIRAQLGLD